MLIWLWVLFVMLVALPIYYTVQALKKSKWKKTKTSISLKEEFYLPVTVAELEKFLISKTHENDKKILTKLFNCLTLISESYYHNVFKKLDLKFGSTFDPKLEQNLNPNKKEFKEEFEFLEYLTFLIEKANFHEISTEEVNFKFF
jgi:hypothetical protein